MDRIKFFEASRKQLENNKIKLVPIILAASVLGGCNDKESSCNQSRPAMEYVNSLMDEFYRKEKTMEYTFTQWGFECEKIENNYYRIKKDCKNNIIYCASLDEFKNYVDIKNPTFDDIQNLLDNSNMNEKYKSWLLEGLKNVKVKLEDLDLVALYYNLKRINIIEQTTTEIIEQIGTPGAYFDIATGEVFVDPETVNSYTLCHEIIGHGISDIEIDYKGTTIHYMPSSKIIYADFDNDEYRKENLGISLEEGKADLISDIATNRISGGPYDAEAEQLRIFNETTNTTLTDFINNGVIGLMKNMRKSDIDHPIDYIVSVDQLLNAEREYNLRIPTEYTIEHNVVNFFKDYADDKVLNDKDKEKIKTTISVILDNSTYTWITAGEVFAIDSVSIETLKQKSLNEIDNLDAKTLIK